MAEKMRTVGPAIRAWLDQIAGTTDPNTGRPVAVPYMAQLRDATARLDAAPDPGGMACVMLNLLARANSIGMAPPPVAPLIFPKDHALHPQCGKEWYWVGTHIDVIGPGPDGLPAPGRVAIMFTMQKYRIVSLDVQAANGWSDLEAHVFTNIVTATIDMGLGARTIVRRTRNVQWPAKGGMAAFSAPGEDFFFQCGPDAMFGSTHVLPLRLLVDDGSNLTFDLTLNHGDFVDLETSFFLQGEPFGPGMSGNGITPIPTPGIYYNWPQLSIEGTLTIEGQEYAVLGGRGWVGHQMMMTSLENAEGNSSIPFVDDPEPINAWLWQYYNLEQNNWVFTGAGFVQGDMTDAPRMPYGYFILPQGRGWQAIFIEGQMGLLFPQPFPPIAGACEQPGPAVSFPLVRTYSGIENPLYGDPLAGVATPWHIDGTFNNPDWTLCAEFPADYTDITGKYPNGVGFLESVGFNRTADYIAFALAYLAEGQLPPSS